MQPAFTRGFRLHHNGRVIHGAEFPDGEVIVADDPLHGLGTAALSLEDLLKSYHGARVEWAPEDEPVLAADRAAARATNQRLNLRAQQLEKELAAYRRAVAQWEISDGRTYVPLRTLAVIAKAAGRNVETPQWLQHYQRVEQAEAVIERVTAVVPFAEQVAATSGPGPASAVRAVADRLRAALGAAAPTGGPSRAAAGVQQPKEA